MTIILCSRILYASAVLMTLLVMGAVAAQSALPPGSGRPPTLRSHASTASGPAKSFPGSPKTSLPGFHPRRILVKPAEAGNRNAKRLDKMHADLGARVKTTFPLLGGWQVVELPLGADVQAAAYRYLGSGIVSHAELDYEITASATPNDPYFVGGDLWGLHNTGQSGGVVDADIDAPEAWDLRREAGNVIVAIIDTGIRTSHEDLASNIWTNPNEIPGNGLDDDGNGYVDDAHGINAILLTGDPTDDHGHGTHVAGIIGAVGNNGLGMVGVAWQVKLMPCKFMGSSGSGYVSDAITCLEYARANGAQVINASWGLLTYVQALKDAIDAAGRQGILFVAGAGNSGLDNDHFFTFYPAGFDSDNLVAVAATTRSDALDYYSNWGLGTIDVGAPGGEIVSAWFTADDAYTTLSGTSMAAPCVSGVCALMKAQFPGETYFQLLNRIYGTVDRPAGLADKSSTSGRINLARALASTSSAPGNDTFARRLRIGVDNFSISGINVDATAEPQEPAHAGQPSSKSIWWSWRPSVPAVATATTAGSSFNTVLSVYTGSSVTQITLVAENDDDPAGGTSSRVTFNADPANEYALVVDGVSGASGSTVLELALLPRPANDNFTNRLGITGSLATARGSNTVATLEPGEPLHAGQAGGSSVWWSWTAAASDPAIISTAGSEFDTLLAVYTGNVLSNLVMVAANDNDPAGGTSSRVTFGAVAGVTYQVAVDGVGGATGKIVLQTPPRNDHFTQRITITDASSAAVGYNALATKDALEPAHAGNAGGKSLWWSWTCPASRMVTWSTAGSTFDTLLAVYTGSALGALTPVAANDNSPFGGTVSLVSFNAVAGQTYQIAVDGANGASGEVKLVLGSEYVITDLGALGGGFDYSEAKAINERNQVVGQCYNYPGYEHRAFLWSDGVMQPLGTLGGSESEALGINDLGQVVGWSRSSWGIPRGFIWQNGVMRDLGSLEPNAYTEAWAINNAGQVVGFSSAGGRLHGFLWHDGIMIDLTPDGSSRCWAMSINQAGQITGQNGWAPSIYVNPFFWNNGIMTMAQMPVDTLSGAGRGINNYGQVAGEYYLGDDRAFLWDNGVFTDVGVSIGGLWAKGISINDAGHVVGQADVRAFIWQGDRIVDLNTFLPPNSGWSLYGANAINNRGQVVGWGTLNGVTRAFLMTPPTQSLPAPYLNSPTNGQTCFAASGAVPLEVLLSPSAIGVSRIEVREGGTLLSVATNSPVSGPLMSFRGSWSNPSAGQHTLQATAFYDSGQVTASRTVTVSVALPPSLSYTRVDGQLLLTWPSTPGTFLLESTTNLALPASWLLDTNNPEILNGTNYVSLTTTNGSRFYRLRLTAKIAP